MRVIDPGHVYDLQWLDGKPPLIANSGHLVFVKREGDKYPGNVGHHAGTTIQEVLRALIDRLKYLDDQEHDYRNDMCVEHLRHVIWLLETRAAERHGRPRPHYNRALEYEPTCSKCLHIGCEGTCHD